MRFVALMALSLSLSAVADTKKVSFSVGGASGMGYSYYNCDSVESTVYGLIERLGGTNTRVNCSGGLDTWSHMPPMPAYVTATFDVTGSTGGPIEALTLRPRGNPDCDLNVTALETILPQFSNIKVMKKNASCWDGNSRWSYDLQIAH